MSPDTPAGVPVTLLLAFVAVVCALSCLGLFAMRGFYDKLHYLSPPAILSTAAIAVAITVQEGVGATAAKAWLVLLVMTIGNPVITFAAARAFYLRQRSREAARKAGASDGTGDNAGEDAPREE